MVTYFIIPLFIFLARILDVSLGTIRIIFVSKGLKRIAPLIGFVEILIWIIAISEIMRNLNNWVCYVAYAGGFAAGNFVGMLIEERLAIGVELVRIITKKQATELRDVLKDMGYGVTFVKARGIEGEVAVLYTVVRRNQIKEVITIIKKLNPNAFYTIEDIRSVRKEFYYPGKKNSGYRRLIRKK